jgi:hypothetical protein
MGLGDPLIGDRVGGDVSVASVVRSLCFVAFSLVD